MAPRLPVAAWGFLPALLLAAACNGGVTADPGLGAVFRVANAQYFPGALASKPTGPALPSIELKNGTVFPGARNRSVAGRVGPGGVAVAFQLEGDTGYWVIPAGPPDSVFPDQASFSASVSFSTTLTLGPHKLFVSAVDATGLVGPSNSVSYQAIAFAAPRCDVLRDPSRPSTVCAFPATCGLVVSLQWDTESDLDLRVVEPGGTELSPKTFTSYTPPGPDQPNPPGIGALHGTGGHLLALRRGDRPLDRDGHAARIAIGPSLRTAGGQRHLGSARAWRGCAGI
jgi:hypothetical protein